MAAEDLATVELATAVASHPCPNPFCRIALPSRRGDLALTYALVGTVARDELEAHSGLSPAATL